MMTVKSGTLEKKRLALQADLDRHKTQAERNCLGQFATPGPLAEDILRYAQTLIPARHKIHFLDPALGTGSFYSALLNVFHKSRIRETLGFEIDPHYGMPAAGLWKKTGLITKLSDFTQAQPCRRFNLIICNPPYVRHHHLENGNKTRLQLRTYQASGMKISGLAGLYCYFLGLSHAWMADGGIAGWLIPSEFMNVNYGQIMKHYLLGRVTLLHIHRFDPNDVQFADALVSSAVVWFRKASPPKEHTVKFTYGGTLLNPKFSCIVPAHALACEPKWTRFPTAGIRSVSGVATISHFFGIKRGLATGCNDFFILSEEQIKLRGLPMEVFKPILPSPRYLTTNHVTSDKHGNPDIARKRFLLDTQMPEDEIKRRFPRLHVYLEEGKKLGLHTRYLCQHRSLWYTQETRPPSPIVCTYLGRGDSKNGRPFRFILNSSKATVANVYLAMYPRPILAQAMERDPNLIHRVWLALNNITPDHLLSEGRVYGGGLHKLEPRELANVPARAIEAIIPQKERFTKQLDFASQFTY